MLCSGHMPHTDVPAGQPTLSCLEKPLPWTDSGNPGRNRTAMVRPGLSGFRRQNQAAYLESRHRRNASGLHPLPHQSVRQPQDGLVLRRSPDGGHHFICSLERLCPPGNFQISHDHSGKHLHAVRRQLRRLLHGRHAYIGRSRPSPAHRTAMPLGVTFAWIFFIAILGVTMAIPMKRQMINIEQIKFPDSIATAETLKVLYSEGKKAAGQAKALLYSALFASANAIAMALGGKNGWEPSNSISWETGTREPFSSNGTSCLWGRRTGGHENLPQPFHWGHRLLGLCTFPGFPARAFLPLEPATATALDGRCGEAPHAWS